MTLLLSFFAVMVFSTPIVKIATEAVTGTKTGGGIAMTAYLAMGLNEDSLLYPGWYNIYVDGSYSDAEMNTDRQRKAASELISRKWDEYRKDPWYTLDFFSRKNASQWNNPDFESVWVKQYRESANPDYPLVLQYLESVKGADAYNRMMNRIHFIILFGVFLFVFLKKEKTDIELYYCMVIIGGFIFHTFWEAKSQYILPYFVLMLPLFVAGSVELVRLCRKSNNIFREKRLMLPLFITVLLFFAVGLGVSQSLTCIIDRSEDTERYEEYLITPQEGFESPW
jgi:hypothetical protein